MKRLVVPASLLLLLMGSFACESPFTHTTFAPPVPTATVTSTPTQTATPPPQVIIDIPSLNAYPAAVTVAVGGTVIWNNNAGVFHSLVMGDLAGTCAAPMFFNDGESVTLSVFGSPGTYYYYDSVWGSCLIIGNCDSGCPNAVVVY